MVVSAGKKADLQRLDMLLSLREISVHKLASNMSVRLSNHEFAKKLEMVFDRLLAKFSNFMNKIEARITRLIVLFQLNQRYRDVRPVMASLRPCAALSALLILPVNFRVPQEDRCP